jgi:starvation-inducible outer membrane lipoprotein
LSRKIGEQAPDMFRLISLLPLAGLTACATAYWSPPDWPPPAVERRIEAEATLSEILESPERFEGRIVMFNGIVRGTTRRGDVTELELHPSPKDTAGSQDPLRARFPGFVEPAIPPGTLVTLIGRVTGESADARSDEHRPAPIVEAAALAVWP